MCIGGNDALQIGKCQPATKIVVRTRRGEATRETLVREMEEENEENWTADIHI